MKRAIGAFVVACGMAACAANEDYTPMIPVQPGAAARASMLLGRMRERDAGAEAEAEADAEAEAEAEAEARADAGVNDGGDAG